MESHGQPQLPRPISRIFFRGCGEDAKTALRSRIPIHEGGLLSDELLQATLRMAKAFHQGFEVLVSEGLRQEDFLRLPAEIQRKVTPPACDDGVNVTIYDPAGLPKRIRIDGKEQQTMLIEQIAPAHSGHGVVKVSVIIGRDGRVLNVEPESGPESLAVSAVEAVRQWKYTPVLLNGIPVEVQTTVEIEFP